MKPTVLRGLSLAACAIPISIVTAAPVTLIDPLAPLRNGGFEDNGGFEEDAAAQTLTAAPWWDSYFAEGDAALALTNETPRSGLRHALMTGYQGTGNRVHPSQTIDAATWTIEEGDIFSIRFYAKAATGFDAGVDQAQVIFHVVNSAGNLVSDAVAGEFAADRQMSRDFAIPAGGNWQECSAVSKPVRAGSPWIGQRLKMRILHTGDRSESMALDDVTLTANRAEAEGSATLLAGYAMEGNLDDDSGQSRHGSGAAAFGPGFGQGTALAGAESSAAQLPFAASGSYSLTFWFKTAIAGTSGTALRWDEGSALLDGDGFGASVRGHVLAFGAGNRTLQSRSAVDDATWHHAVLTRSAVTGAMQLFLDGRLEANASGLPGSTGTLDPLAPGRARGGGRIYQGLLDELEIYEGVLSAEQVRTLHLGTGDSDGDGRSNADEEVAGTAWGEAADFLKPAALGHDGAGGFRIDLAGKSGRCYKLLRNQDLTSPGAEVAVSPVLESDAPLRVSDPAPPPGRAFYRVTAEKATPPRPNILLIIADDHGYADLGAYAHARPDIKTLTPNLDRIAQGGALFTQGYCAGPVCSPARAGLITGRYPHEWDASGGWTPGLPLNAPTVAEYLHDAGYATAMLGKSDYGKGFFSITTREHPLKHGFDSFFGFSAHAHDYYLHSQDIASRTTPGPNDGSAHLGPFISNNAWEAIPDGKWLPEELTDRALGYIQTHATGQPFFLNLCYNSVHSLIHQVPQAYLDAEGLPRLPDYDPALATAANPKDYTTYYQVYSRPNRGVAGDSARQISDADMRRYYRAHLRAFDAQIGRVLDGLQAAGLAENTLVVYLSDNGGEALTGANNLPLAGCKYNVYEGGIRVPFMIRWPGRIPAGISYPHVVSSLDLAPTFLEAARVEEAPNLRGHPLLKPLREQREVVAGGRTLFWRFNEHWAVRHGDWKLVFSNKGESNHTSQIRFNTAALNKVALFDLANDPGETTDLADDPAHAAKRTELQALYSAWQGGL